jgi:hypothetical protein
MSIKRKVVELSVFLSISTRFLAGIDACDRLCAVFQGKQRKTTGVAEAIEDMLIPA